MVRDGWALNFISVLKVRIALYLTGLKNLCSSREEFVKVAAISSQILRRSFTGYSHAAAILASKLASKKGRAYPRKKLRESERL